MKEITVDDMDDTTIEKLDESAIVESLKKDPMDTETYVRYAALLEKTNLKQAYLTYENALYYCKDDVRKKEIRKKLKEIETKGGKVEPVSMVILSYNHRDLTQQCIESIRETTPESAREIVIVDNNSQDDSVEYLKQQKDIVLVANYYNAGFPGGCNIGIRASRPENDILLLNNDTIMCVNSLYTLRMGLYEKENYGAAGSVTTEMCNGQSIIKSENISELKELGIKHNIYGRQIEHKVLLMGFAILIKRHVLEEVGYLDERFFPGNKEDEDFGLRVLMKHYQNVLVRNSFLIHLGNRSFGTNPDRARLVYKNLVKLNKKHGFEPEVDTGVKSITDFVNHWYASQIEDGMKRILEINCEFGVRLLKIQYEHPEIECYGIDKTKAYVNIAHNLETVHIEHYINIEINPFFFTRFDFIALDCRNIKLEELDSYIDTCSQMLAEGGKMFVVTRNHSYYKNWYPMLTGEKKGYETYSPDVVYNTDLDMSMKKYGMRYISWIFYYGNTNDIDYKDKLEALVPIVGEDKRIMFENIAALITK